MEQEQYFPLNISQADLFLDNVTNVGNSKNVIINTVWAYADQDCDFSALEKSFWQIVADNDCLRLRLFKKRGKKYQTIQDIVPYSLPVIKAEGKNGFDQLVSDYEDEDFSIFSPCLFRARLVDCGSGAGGIQVRIHHIACDGYSLGMFLKEIDRNYWAVINGETPGKKKVFSFREAVESDKVYLSGPEYQRDLSWWETVYRSVRHCSFPLGRMILNNESDCADVSLGTELSEKLCDYCKENHISLQSAVMSMAGAYVAHLTGRDAFFIYSLLHNRSNYRLKQTMGCMVALAPVLFRMDSSQTVESFLSQHYSEYIDIAIHSRFPNSGHIPLCARLGIKSGMNFDFSWMEYSMMDYLTISRSTKLKTGMADHHALAPDTYLYLLNTPDEGIILKLDYRVKKLSRAKAEKHLRGLASLLARAMEHPQEPMGSILKEEI